MRWPLRAVDRESASVGAHTNTTGRRLRWIAPNCLCSYSITNKHKSFSILSNKQTAIGNVMVSVLSYDDAFQRNLITGMQRSVLSAALSPRLLSEIIRQLDPRGAAPPPPPQLRHLSDMQHFTSQSSSLRAERNSIRIISPSEIKLSE